LIPKAAQSGSSRAGKLYTNSQLDDHISGGCHSRGSEILRAGDNVVVEGEKMACPRCGKSMQKDMVMQHSYEQQL